MPRMQADDMLVSQALNIHLGTLQLHGQQAAQQQTLLACLLSSYVGNRCRRSAIIGQGAHLLW